MIKECFPLMLMSFGLVAMAKIDQLVLYEIHGPSLLGQYSIAVKLVELLQFAPLILISTYFPKISSSMSHTQAWRFSYLFGCLFWLSITLALLLTFCSSFIVSILYGESFKEAGEILPYYAWMIIVFYYVLAQQRYLILKNKTRYILYIFLLGPALNVVLNLILVPQYSAKGAITATALAYVITQILLSTFLKELRESAFLLYTGVALFIKQSLRFKFLP
jgi:O-antigen/teichoic acid export membrane protein